jgi:hypothetical protein
MLIFSVRFEGQCGKGGGVMSDAHRAVLAALHSLYDSYDGGGYAHFAYVIKETGFSRQVVRRICRHLARQGLAEYCRGLWSEDGRPAGAGYGITRAGIAALEAKEE